MINQDHDVQKNRDTPTADGSRDAAINDGATEPRRRPRRLLPRVWQLVGGAIGSSGGGVRHARADRRVRFAHRLRWRGQRRHRWPDLGPAPLHAPAGVGRPGLETAKRPDHRFSHRPRITRFSTTPTGANPSSVRASTSSPGRSKYSESDRFRVSQKTRTHLRRAHRSSRRRPTSDCPRLAVQGRTHSVCKAPRPASSRGSRSRSRSHTFRFGPHAPSMAYRA